MAYYDFSENKKKVRKKLTPAAAKEKIAAYCAYQERCQQEVRTKLYEYQLSSDDVDELIVWLITEGFLNEERFAQSYVRGKFRIKKWGRIKILQGLKQKNISEYCIKSGMKEIDPEEYWNTLCTVAEQRASKTTAPNDYIRQQKLAQYLMSRGFETDLVWEAVKSLESR
ncbi:regulatory protein RecX [Penaeicola halotolerans]|uniref:regulatory protein RecX n=1 Tax=Penaeicola halotolerans TaxID=2793196 RepID=UPI001CF8DF73|nr:regulatory protein RecX [Penaeicola halotolerans]